MQKYLGIYTLFYEKDILSQKTIIDKHTKKNNIYLKGKYNIEIYRYDKSKLSIFFPSTQTSNNIVPQLESKGLKLNLLCEGDSESIYICDEKSIDVLHECVKLQIKGKLEQLKENKLKLKEGKNNSKV